MSSPNASNSAAPEPGDEQIQALLAFQGISVPDGDVAGVLRLARYFLGRAALIAGPLPYDLDSARGPSGDHP